MLTSSTPSFTQSPPLWVVMRYHLPTLYPYETMKDQRLRSRSSRSSVSWDMLMAKVRGRWWPVWSKVEPHRSALYLFLDVHEGPLRHFMDHWLTFRMVDLTSVGITIPLMLKVLKSSLSRLSYIWPYKCSSWGDINLEIGPHYLLYLRSTLVVS